MASFTEVEAFCRSLLTKLTKLTRLGNYVFKMFSCNGFVDGAHVCRSYGNVQGAYQMHARHDIEVNHLQITKGCMMQNTVFYDYEQKPNNEATATLFDGRPGVVAGIAAITEFDVDHPAFIINDTWSRRVTWAWWEEDPDIGAYDFVMDFVYGNEEWPGFNFSPDLFREEPLWDLDDGSPWFDGLTSIAPEDATYGYLNWKWTYAGQWQCNVEMSVVAEGAIGGEINITFVSIGGEVNFGVGGAQMKPFTASPIHHATPTREVVFDDNGWYTF